MFDRSEAHPGLHLLVQAHDYAEEFKRPVWDFAVEISSLRRAGFSNNDLRWLVCQGYCEHRCEVTSAGEDRRMFRRRGQWNFYKRSCFILTEEGVRRVRKGISSAPVHSNNGNAASHGGGAVNANRVLSGNISNGAGSLNGGGTSLVDANGSNGAHHRNGNGEEQAARDFPLWDAARQELRVGDSLVKQFRLPAPNQGRILMAFEEEGWPSRIDDPLPPQPDLDPKRRLHDTIKSLNRNQKHRLLRFKGDGQGLGILWEFIPAVKNGQSPAKASC